eukprot:m.261106 g.261106  ORF g.261106 m.261106 type:complete len:74 (+) comp26660_c0_seq1:727-948(+)
MTRTAGGCTGGDGARTTASAPTELASQLKAALLYEPLDATGELDRDRGTNANRVVRFSQNRRASRVCLGVPVL